MSVPSLVHQYGSAPVRAQAEIGTVSASLALQSQPWPLPVGASLLQPYFQREEHAPDLADFAASGTVECHCAPDLRQSKVYAPFSVAQKPLPPTLAPLLAKHARVGFVGLGEKGTLYISSDSETYLWNLGSERVRRFGSDAVDAMELMPANKSVFSENVERVLVVSAREEIRLYAVDKDDKLFDTDLAISISGLGAPTIRTSAGGRIFFTCANTGTALFEFRYAAKETWFSAKAKRVCHGEFGGFLGGLFGTHTVSKDAESVRDIQIDDSVHAVYVLTSRSAVHVYDFAPTGLLVTLVKNLSVSQIVHGLRTHRPNPADRELLSLCAVGLQESKFVRLVALTAAGSRIFFRGDARIASGIKVSGIQLVAAPELRLDERDKTAEKSEKSKDAGMETRPHTGVAAQPGSAPAAAPAAVPAASAAEKPGTAQAEKPKAYRALPGSRVVSAHTAHILMAPRRVLSSAIDTARVAYQHDTGHPLSFVELSGFFTVDGDVVLLAHAGPGVDLLLTPSSLYVVHARPFSERFEYADVAFAVAQVYGPMQTCCGALHTVAHTSSRYARENAIAAYFRFGGLPMFKRDQVHTGFLNDRSIRLSALFDGLALYLARLLRPVWTARVLQAGDAPPAGAALDALQRELGALVAFLDRNRSFSEGMSDRSGYSNSSDAAVLSQAEYRGLQCLGRLAKNCQEGVAFVRLVLTKHNAKQVLSYFDPKRLELFRKMTFGELFTVDEKSEIVRELVNSLVNCVLNQGESLDTIAATIQNSCPTYCSSAEVLEYKALELIHQAKEQREPDSASLARSVTLVCQAAASIQLDTLQDIVKDYVHLKFYSGAVNCALAVAAEQDPANLAVGYLRQMDQPEQHALQILDPKRRVLETLNVSTYVAELHAIPVSSQQLLAPPASESLQKYQAKTRVYNVIFSEVLAPHPELVDPATKDPTRAIMLDSQDEVWHFALYDWLLDHGRQEQVALLDTPFVANYLLLGAAKDLRIADLLWRWYQRRGDLLATVDVLLDLARGPLATSLAQRVEFLSRAMAYCRALSQHTQQADKMTTMVRAYLGLALIQTSIRAKSTDPRLDTRIYTATDLFNEFARPMELYDVCFELIKFTDLRDPVIVEVCWLDMLHKERSTSYSEGAPHFAQVKHLVAQMGTKYKDCLVIFDPEKLVPMLEQYAVEYTPTAPSGWVVDALLDAGVDAHVLGRIYDSVLKNKVLTGDAVHHAVESYKYLRAQVEKVDPLASQRAIAA